MYQLYLYFEANTCLQEMAHWSRCAVQNHTAKINSVWFVPHLPNFNHQVCQTMNILCLNFHMCGSSNWASEASPTLGCSIEISRDICRYIYN